MYQTKLESMKLVIWDGVSSIKCGTGVFQAEEIKKHWNIRPGVNVFYITAKNSTVAKIYGTDLGSSFDSEDVVECGKLQVKGLVESEIKNTNPDAPDCTMDEIEQHLEVVDLRS